MSGNENNGKCAGDTKMASVKQLLVPTALN
jgi:hypothetical protein